MRHIGKPEHKDPLANALKERDRLSIELDLKRSERVELEKSKFHLLDTVEIDLLQHQINNKLIEIENLQIAYMKIYFETSSFTGEIYDIGNSIMYKFPRASHIPNIPVNGDIVLKALRGILVHGAPIEANESFAIDNKTARDLLQGQAVIVDERYLVVG